MKIRKIIGDGNEQLIGGNFLNDTSGSYSSLSSFKLETNFTGKINTNYDNVLTSFSNPISLESINLKESDSELILTNKRVELNFDKSDLKSYIRFGSVVDYMKSAIHNIILDYPASLYIDSEEYKSTQLYTISDYIPNIYLNKSNFKINSNYISNKFGLIYNKDNLNIPDDIELRNLNLSYQDYVVYYNGGEYNILNFIGSYNGFINIEVEGLPFGEETLLLTNKTFHIKPKPIIFNKIRKNFGKLENYFLQNRLSDNSGFEIIIKEPFLMDDGRITYQDRKLLWTTTDGYNVDYEGGNFNSFVESLINISNNYDNTKTDLINRFLTPPSLKIYDNTQEKKIEKLLRIWGRNFDEVKQYIDALTKINKLSYDKKNNIPDVLVKNLARSFGWDDITLVKDDELINNFFAVDYEEKPTDFLPVEIDIELWRRILINTNFFWKTKGTRQAILAMFKLIGIPEPFINIKEYIYTVDEVINPDEVDLSLEDLYSSSLPYNKDGNPIAPIETNNFFFQISGDTDNGQHYMNNFRKSGFVLNQIEDNKKSWVYSGETIREHGSTVQYYQESSDLVLNTKQVDISLDIANAVEYDVFDYIKNVDYPNNSPDYAKKFTFININTDFETSGNTYELPEEPVGDVQVSLNGITLRNGINNDYYVDENNNKIIHLNGSIETNDIILISYLFKQNNNDDVELLTQTIKYVVAKAIINNDGNMIILPEEPNGDIQLTMNGISLSRSGDNFIGDYSINPNDTKQFFINNDTLKDMISNNNNIVQLSYLTSESGYDLNQRSEFYKINNFNSTKLYFDTQINRFVYVLNLKVNNINDIRFTLNGITLSPEKEYQLSTIDERNILLPPQIGIGDILGFYYVTSESGVNDLTVPDSFGVGDISNLSFLEFVDLLEKKLINVKNRKVITDNKGGFYPTLLRVYIQYLKRGELEDDNILQSNGYTYDNLYEFLNKYNSFFYNFTKKLLPATVIYGKSGFMIRNSVFSKQKFTYKRGVSINIVDGVGVPNNDLEWLGNDGSEFRVLQSGGKTVENITLLIDSEKTYYYQNGNCYNCNIGIKTNTNTNITNKISISVLLTFDDNSSEDYTIIMDNINQTQTNIQGFYNTPNNIKIESYSNLNGDSDYEIDNSIKSISYKSNLNIQPTFEKLSIINATVTQRGFDEVFNNRLVDVEFEMNKYVEGIELEIRLESDTTSEYFTISDFNRNGNYFSLFNHELSVESGGILKFNDRLDDNIFNCNIKYFVDTNEFVEYTFIPYVEPQPNEDKVVILVDETYPYYYLNKNCKTVVLKLQNLNNNESIYDGENEYDVRYQVNNFNNYIYLHNENLDNFNILVLSDTIPYSYEVSPENVKLLSIRNSGTDELFNIDTSTIPLKYNSSKNIPADEPIYYDIISAKLIRQTYQGLYNLEIELNNPLQINRDVYVDAHIFFNQYYGLSEGLLINHTKLKQGTTSTYIYQLNISAPYSEFDSQRTTVSLDSGNDYITCNSEHIFSTQTKGVAISSIL